MVGALVFNRFQQGLVVVSHDQDFSQDLSPWGPHRLCIATCIEEEC